MKIRNDFGMRWVTELRYFENVVMFMFFVELYALEDRPAE